MVNCLWLKQNYIVSFLHNIYLGIYGVWRGEASLKRESYGPGSKSPSALTSPKSLSSPSSSLDDTPFPIPMSHRHNVASGDLAVAAAATSPSLDALAAMLPTTDKSNPHFLDFCPRIGPTCLCFCLHLFADHEHNPVAHRHAST